MTARAGVIPSGNTLYVYVTDLKKASDDTAITDATIEFTLKDLAGVAVAGCDGVGLTNQGSGNYDKEVTPTTALTKGASYQAIIEATNYTLKWEEWIEAVPRTFEM